jgi:predicted nucleic-acid-binding Zn-ribbon protein
MTNYKDQYRHPLWQKKRLEILQRDDFTCVKCGETEVELHVHHHRYKNGRNIWDYENDNFITLCNSCHKQEHNEMVERLELYENILTIIDKYDVISVCYVYEVMKLFEKFHKAGFYSKLYESLTDERAEKLNEILDQKTEKINFI